MYGEQKNLKHVYRNLKEHQYYLFWVIANTNVGEGSASVKVSQTPLSRGNRPGTIFIEILYPTFI